MLQKESKLIVADNSGAKLVKIIHIDGPTGKKYAYISDIVTVSVKVSIPNSGVKKGEIYKAIIVRSRYRILRKDGSSIMFDDNACVLLNSNKEIKGTRVFGPIAKEIKEKGYNKISSLASEVI